MFYRIEKSCHKETKCDNFGACSENRKKSPQRNGTFDTNSRMQEQELKRRQLKRDMSLGKTLNVKNDLEKCRCSLRDIVKHWET